MSLPCARWSERAVHAGYTQQQQVAECNGHERSRRVTGNCRSSHRPRYSHGVLLDDDGAPDPEKVKAANSELLARRPHYAKRIGGDVGQGARPGQAEQGAMGIIQSRTRQIRCHWYRRIIVRGMTKS